MSWFWTIVFLFLSLISSNSELLAEANRKHEKKLSPAVVVVVGRVLCDTCFKQDHLPKGSHFIPGASVEVECRATSTTTSAPTFRQETKTDSKGQFKVNLPFSFSKHLRKIESCSVRLLRSSEPFCSVAAAAESSSLHLKSRKSGVHVYSAGFFSFKPMNQPYVCDQKPSSFEDRKDFSPVITNPGNNNNNNPGVFLPPFQDPNSGLGNLPVIGRYLPPLPQLPTLPPLPQLPSLPSLPGIPFMPPKGEGVRGRETGEEKVITTPQQFPPIPNPFQPPPAALFPPIPFQPPPSAVVPPPASGFPQPIFGSPPVPGLIPPSSPAGGLPINFPPFPFQPVPGFPGVPPANREGSSELKSSRNP